MAGVSLDEVLALPRDELIDRYARGIEMLDRRVFELDDAMLDTAFLPRAGEGFGTWPVRVLLGHLADAEMVLLMRMRRAVAEDRPLLAVFDEHAFIDSGIYGTPETGPRHPIAAYIAVMYTMRRWGAPWLGAIGEEGWNRAALHPERGAQTVSTIVAYATWHVEHHGAIMTKKIDRLLGTG